MIKWKYVVNLCAILLSMFSLSACDEDAEEAEGSEDTHNDNKSNQEKGTIESDASIKTMQQHCPGQINENKDIYYCIIPAGEITNETVKTPSELEWTPDVTYILNGKVRIGDGVGETILKILPGTTILGEPVTELDNSASLIIQRNSKIYAEGTSESPIVFSSANEIGKRANDDWGGIVISGNAPINTCGAPPCEANGEGETGTFGGSDENDNSGVLAYVRIEFSGKRLDSKTEFNGLTLQGVGRGTDIHHIQIHRPGDDAIEFFGGTAQVHHILLSGTGDDSFDWTHGWRGKAQFVIALHISDLAGDQGIEADNFENNFEAEPRSNPTLVNFTTISNGPGYLLRRGTAANLINHIVVSAGNCLNLDDVATWNQADNGSLSISNSIAANADCFSDQDGEGLGKLESEFWSSGEGNRIADPMLGDYLNLMAPDVKPQPGSPALSGAGAPPAGDSFFETVDFIGAIGVDDWTRGWTSFPVN